MNISFHYFRSLLIATYCTVFTLPALGATFVSEYGAYNSVNSVYLEFPAGGGYPSGVWAPSETGVGYYNGICNAATQRLSGASLTVYLAVRLTKLPVTLPVPFGAAPAWWALMLTVKCWSVIMGSRSTRVEMMQPRLIPHSIQSGHLY